MYIDYWFELSDLAKNESVINGQFCKVFYTLFKITHNGNMITLQALNFNGNYDFPRYDINKDYIYRTVAGLIVPIYKTYKDENNIIIQTKEKAIIAPLFNEHDSLKMAILTREGFENLLDSASAIYVECIIDWMNGIDSFR